MMWHCTWCIYCSFLLSKGQVLTVHSHWLCAQLQLIFLAVLGWSCGCEYSYCSHISCICGWIYELVTATTKATATKIIGFNKPLKWLVKQRGAPAPVVIMLSAITDFIREAIDDGASTLTVVTTSGNYYLHCSTAWTYSWIRENTKLIVQKHNNGSHKTFHAVTLWWFLILLIWCNTS